MIKLEGELKNAKGVVEMKQRMVEVYKDHMEKVLQQLKRETKASMKKEQASVGELELQRGNIAALERTKTS